MYLLLGYVPIDAVGHAAIMKAARAHNMDPRELANMLIRGRLLGDMTGMRIVGRSLGQPAMRAFVHADGYSTAEQAKELADRMGLPEAIELLESDERGDGFPVFSWHARSGSGSPPSAILRTPSNVPCQENAVPASGELISGAMAGVVAALQRAVESKGDVAAVSQAAEHAIGILEAVAPGSEPVTGILQQLYAMRDALQRTDGSLVRAKQEITTYLRSLGVQY